MSQNSRFLLTSISTKHYAWKLIVSIDKKKIQVWNVVSSSLSIKIFQIYFLRP